MSRLIWVFFCCTLISTYSCNDNLENGEQGNEPNEMDDNSEAAEDPCVTTGPEQIADCLGEINEKTFCDSTNNPDPDKYCGPSFIGEYFLSEASRDICSRLCRSAVREHRYENSDGKVLSFMPDARRVSFGHSVSYTNIPCPDDASKSQLLCFHRDFFNVYYESLEGGTSFLIRLFPHPSTWLERDSYLHYDVLEILDFPEPGSSRGKLRIVTDDMCTSVAETLGSARFDSMILNGKTYTDVYAEYPSFQGQSKYYFTIEQGVIAIEPTDGDVYTLVV